MSRITRIIVPRRWAAFSVLRGIPNPMIDATLDRDQKFIRLLNDLEAGREGNAAPRT
jgi:hypothetical protein